MATHWLPWRHKSAKSDQLACLPVKSQLLLRTSGLIGKLVVLNALVLPGAFIGEQLVGGSEAKAQEISCETTPGSGEIGEAGYIPPGIACTVVPPGLWPRNPDGSGRGMAAFSNRLADTLFERLPLRQFDPFKVVEEEEVIPDPEEQEEVPVRGLWNKRGDLTDQDAQRALDQAIAQEARDSTLTASTFSEEPITLEWKGSTYRENPSFTNRWAQRDKVRAWVRGFGGSTSADWSGILYNDFSATVAGVVGGADVSLSDDFQMGAYVNYGSINLDHHGIAGGGGWNPDGVGGGFTAEYWTTNFYAQGIVGLTWFEGVQDREVLKIIDDWGGDRARGSKSARTFTGGLKLGAPFRWDAVVLEPQAQLVATQNQEYGFSETRGTRKELRLKYYGRTTNFLETALGMKFSIPIKSGDRALWVPSLRAAWLADWDQGNEPQTIGYTFTNKTIDLPSKLDNENAALVELGLDYTVQNFDEVSIKVYGRGGMEFWGSDRGTAWRASGGVTFQF